MREYRVAPCRKSHPAELGWQVVEAGNLDAGDVLEIAGAITVAADTVGGAGDLSGDVADIVLEAFPLLRDALIRLERIPLAKSGDQQGESILEPRGIQFNDERVIHGDRLHKGDVGEMSLRAHVIGRHAELVPEGTREGLMRTVSGIERHSQDVWCACG